MASLDDTALDSPDDTVEQETSQPISGHIYRAGSRSIVMLLTEVHEAWVL